jgi:hypothetical protein
MNKSLLLIPLFIFISCEFSSYTDLDRQIFFNSFKSSVFNAHKVISKHSKYFNNDKEVSRPKNTWQNLLQFFSYDKIGREISYCLNYKIPFESKSGELSYFVYDRHSECPLTPEGKEINNISHITSLKIFLSSKSNKNMKLSAYELLLRYDHKEIEYENRIPLVNLKNNKLIIAGDTIAKLYDLEKYSSSIRKGKFNTATFLLNSNVRNDGHFISSEFKYGEKDPVACHKVEKNCSTSLEFKCNQCSGGWFEVVDYKCPQGGSKYCGRSNCGELNQPACPRGGDYVGLEYSDVCFDGSPAGICQKGLTPVCIGDKYLVCK